MDKSIFAKMKVKPGMHANVYHAPPSYPENAELNWSPSTDFDFIHLFVTSKSQFEDFFPQAVASSKQNALVWLSYPKSSKHQTYDINRNSLWDLLIPCGWHPVAQISLDEKWSAIRLKPNEMGTEYSRPKSKGVLDEK